MRTFFFEYFNLIHFFHHMFWFISYESESNIYLDTKTNKLVHLATRVTFLYVVLGLSLVHSSTLIPLKVKGEV